MTRPLSLYIDLLRLAAALVVFIVHAQFLLPGGVPALWRLSSLGGEAVTVFFVLSGFVIAHVVRTREASAIDYAAARLARLYSVALPALAVTLLLDLARAASLQDQAASTLASLLFVNEVWFNALRPPSNTPFWSLGYEFWYYAIYGAARFVPGRARKYASVALLGIACGPKILLLMPAWLFGVAAYVHARRLCTKAALIVALLSTAGLCALVATGAKPAWHAASFAAQLGPSAHASYTLVFGALAALHLAAMTTLVPRYGNALARCENPIRKAAALTFAIYLFHYPILKFLVPLAPAAARAPVAMAAALLAIALIGPACDALKPVLLRAFMGQRRLPAGPRGG
jgi:peptidoglycan/LPS O-acetylase OafA/YrhL